MIQLINNLLKKFNLHIVPLKLSEEKERKYSYDELIEYSKCSKDPVYFINKYIKRISYSGSSDFKLYPFQEKIIKNLSYNKSNVLKLARQSGKSFLPVYYYIHQMLFNGPRDICIISTYSYSSKYLLDVLKYSYENLPEFLKIKVLSSEYNKFELENGSRISVLTSMTTDRVLWHFLGKNKFTDILVDELSSVEFESAKNMIEYLYSMSFSLDLKLIITGTKRKASYFNYLINQIKDGYNFNFILNEYDWTAIPNRDDNWKKLMISRIGIDSFNEEFEL